MPLSYEKQFDTYFSQLYLNSCPLLENLLQNQNPSQQIQAGRTPLEKVASKAIKKALHNKSVDFGVIMRHVRSEGIDSSFITRLTDFSSNLFQRTLRAFQLGQRVRMLLNHLPHNNQALFIAGKLSVKYFKAEIALIKHKELYDESEEMATRKELRAFMLGLTGKPTAEFEMENDWLYQKNAAQVILEENLDQINPRQLTQHPSLDTLPPMT